MSLRGKASLTKSSRMQLSEHVAAVHGFCENVNSCVGAECTANVVQTYPRMTFCPIVSIRHTRLAIDMHS